MLTQQEKDFIRYWAANRLRRKKVVTQFLIGIPIGLAFVIPIVINFVSGWYKRAQMEANSQDFNPAVLLIALLLIVGFTAIFYQRHQWDQYEQRYQELLAREARENGPVTEDPHTAPPGSSPTAGINPTPEDSRTPGSPAPNGPDAAPSQDLQQKAGKN
jgi:formate hydrogenlyase subunit 3/multisubunit Na+/H+ antiporter MnhD subunit